MSQGITGQLFCQQNLARLRYSLTSGTIPSTMRFGLRCASSSLLLSTCSARVCMANASSSSRKFSVWIRYQTLAYSTCSSSIKVITITGLIILGIVLDLGGGPNHDRIGFRYWKHPGPFAQFELIGGAKGRFLGWVAVLEQSAFSFIGTEIVAVRFLCVCPKVDDAYLSLIDCCRRGEEPSSQPAEGHPSRLHSHPALLHRRSYHYRSSRPLHQPRPQSQDFRRREITFRHCDQDCRH